MAEYIEREALLNRLCKENCDRPFEPENAVCVNCYLGHVLNREPAADVAPVVHGAWVPVGRDGCDDKPVDAKEWDDWRCSLCYAGIWYNKPVRRSILPKFCLGCGAKMDLEE